MNETVNTIVVNLKEATDKACDLTTKLATVTLDFEIQKHKVRNELYEAKQSGRDRVVVTVVASPLLHRLFADRCAPFRRRQEGALTIFTWLALDHINFATALPVFS